MTATPVSAAASRFHALDALRAAMMFLGIYLHAAVAYSPEGGWPLRLGPLTKDLVWTLSVIHVFRMPIFYAMAGFFSALLVARYGWRGAGLNRFTRIAVPFVVGWIIIWPIQVLVVGSTLYGIDRTLQALASGLAFRYAGPMHLWFLEYLLLFYALAAIVALPVAYLMSEKARAAVVRVFTAVVRSPWAPLALAVPSFAAQLLMPDPWIKDPSGFMPEFAIVAVYAIPFAFGWLLYHSQGLLDVLSRRAWLYAPLAVIACVAYRWSYYLFPRHDWPGFYVIRAVHSLDMWLLILGVTGLFLRYLSGHSPLRRYLCDSSYFLYIAHFPMILVLQVLLVGVPAPPLVKVVLVLVGSIVLLLPLYRWGVRPTFIGAWLNGRRYPPTIGLAGFPTPEKVLATPH